jgi:3-phytase
MFNPRFFTSVTAFSFLCFTQTVVGQTVPVLASMETEPVPDSGDAADDPAIWIHPTDPSLSLIIGTDKQRGLAVYDMGGNEIQFLSDGNLNNVDVRYGFPLGGTNVDIVAAENRSNDSIAVYAIDPNTRMLIGVTAGTLNVGVTAYGSCMYRSGQSGEYFFLVNSKRGDTEQWRLFDNGNGAVDAALVRSFDVGSQTEGCVADDDYADLYIGEEGVGIWKYGAEPGDGTSRELVDSTGAGGLLTADVEGLAIYYTADGGGYLLASSQGADEYVIYERSPANEYVGTFEIISGTEIDGTSDTDGIDVTSHPLGPDFPFGAFVAQDGSNSGGNQNFKIVGWDDIATAFAPELTVDIAWNPRDTPTPPQQKKPRPPTSFAVE